jgi:hypothetical protein
MSIRPPYANQGRTKRICVQTGGRFWFTIPAWPIRDRRGLIVEVTENDVLSAGGNGGSDGEARAQRVSSQYGGRTTST